MISLEGLMTRFVQDGASDIHLRAGSAPMARVDGVIRRTDDPALTPAELEEYTQQLMRHPGQWEEFLCNRDADFSFGLRAVGRFRVNASWQRGSISLIMRVIEDKPIPTFSQLGLPQDTFEELVSQERGLILGM